MSNLSPSELITLDWPPFTEANLFESPDRWHFAGEQADIVKGQLNVHIGNHPMVEDLRKIPTDSLTEEQRKDIIRLRRGYELWLVTFTVGVVTTSELWSISALGLKVAYADEDPSQRDQAARAPSTSGIGIVDALPQTQFITNMEGAINCRAEIGFNGRFEVPNIPATAASMPLAVDGKISASPNVKVAGQVSFAVKSTIIHTIGEGSDFGQWEVKRHGTPFLGTNYFQHVLRLPGDTQKIYATLQVAVVARGFFGLPARVESKPVTLPISL